MMTFRTLLVVPMLVALLAVAGSAPAPYAHAAPAPQTSYVPGDAFASAVRAARDTVEARAELSALAAQYRYLDDVSVTVGTTPGGEEAVAYYTGGRIVIDSAHLVSVKTILAHEIWHIIDWRSDGRFDWDEYVPPASADDYLKS